MARPRTTTAGPATRIFLSYSQELADWVETEIERTGLDRSKVIANCVADAKRRQEQRIEEPTEQDGRTQDALIIAIEEQFFLELACSTAKVTLKQAGNWLKSQAFEARLETARQIFLQRLQMRLLELGQGDAKGGKFGALVRFLEAHDPNYGRVRAELVLRILQQEYKDLMTILAEELGQGQHEALKRALDRYEERRDLRLSSFTE